MVLVCMGCPGLIFLKINIISEGSDVLQLAKLFTSQKQLI